MWFELLILVIGIAFGYLRKGKEDFWGLLKTGAIIGIVLAVIFGLIAFFFAPGDLGLGLGLVGGIGFFIGIILYVIIFLVGAFIGDWLEGMQKSNHWRVCCNHPHSFFSTLKRKLSPGSGSLLLKFSGRYPYESEYPVSTPFVQVSIFMKRCLRHTLSPKCG